MNTFKALLCSSALMAIFYTVLEFYNVLTNGVTLGLLWTLISATIIFALIYLVFAIPLKLILLKFTKTQKFNIIHLFVYLITSLLVHILIYQFFNQFTPFFQNIELFAYAFASSFVFWFWNSIFDDNDK
ncbi:UPF0715 family protein [Bacillus kandeliae]|uniref:UPF0715 family protein n=1 Tax=Bacillus kandeliae TaxID=3129297 RepID=UPI0039B791A7